METSPEHTIGVIGNGFVGKATQIFARSAYIKKLVYDVDPTKCEPLGLTLQQCVDECDLIFVCVPTPMNLQTGKCDTSIVEKVVRQIQDLQYKGGIVVRSTVPPGTCERLEVCHMPEYLTEKNWEQDFINTQIWEFGVPTSPNSYGFANELKLILQHAMINGFINSDQIVVKDSRVTETAKYMRNSMLAVRVGVCNEFETYCRAIGINYDDVRELVTSDPRIGGSHTMVPGHDGKRGFGGTCLPKDMRAISMEMMLNGVQPMILQACLARNELVDRPAKDWLNDLGRAVSITTQKN